MANTDKNIVITPNIGQTEDPKIVYSGANAAVGAQNISLNVYPDNNGTLSWEGSAGQLLSVTNSLTGTIFAVNDVSGIPSITVQDTGQVTLAPYTGNVVVGNTVDASTGKLQVTGRIASDELAIATNTTPAVFVKDDNLTSWDYSGKSFSISAQETAPSGLFFSSDGLRMYVVGTTGDDVNQYDLSVAWDVTTASFVRVSAAIGDTGPTDLFFKPDGTKMYVVASTGDTVREFTVGTPWDVSTISFVTAYSVAGQEITPNGIWFKPDGTKMYIVGSTGDDVNEYDLATPWSLSTGVTFNQLFSVAAQDTNPTAINFSADGTKMFVLGTTGFDINRYSLSVPWDISTAVFYNNFYVGFQSTAPSGMFIDLDNNVAYVTGTGVDTVFQYNTTTDGIALESVSGLFIEGSLYTNKNLVVTAGTRIDGTLDTSGTVTARGQLVVSSTLTASGAVSMNTTTGAINIHTSQTTGIFTLGGTAATGVIQIGRSTAAQTLDLAVGATTTGVTKTINIGTNGVSGSTTNITVGSANGTNTTVNGNLSTTGNLYYNGNILVARSLQVGTRSTVATIPLGAGGNVSILTRAGNTNVIVTT